jgi:hypothetical protein
VTTVSSLKHLQEQGAIHTWNVFGNFFPQKVLINNSLVYLFKLKFISGITNLAGTQG